MTKLITGMSGVGKTTLVEGLSHMGYKIMLEIGMNEMVDFWYEQSTLGGDTDHLAKNMFIMNKLARNYMFALKNNDTIIYDRFIFDDRVAMELRVKNRHPEEYKWMVEKYNSYVAQLKKLGKLPDYAVLLTITDFEVFKGRLLKRGREDEKNHILANESWYRTYFVQYNELITKYINEANIPLKILDVTKLEKDEVLKQVVEFLE